jgi:VanZ family protein
MIQMLRNRIPRDPRSLGAITLLLLLGILIACLWPFRAPKNTVSWVADGRGIAFGRYGVILGSAPLVVPGDRDAATGSIELWLQADPTRDMGSILGVFSAENPRQFGIDEWHSGLAIRSAAVGDPIKTGGAPCFTPDVFTPGKSVFVTITSSERGTDVYLNGSLSKVTPTFRITNKMLAGKLVVGTSATTDDDWRGQLRGLAIYKRALDPEQVRNHYTSWTGIGRPDIRDSDALLALYLFGERTGRNLHNEVPGGNDLYIPEHYIIPAKDVLAPPALDNWADIISNIVGFLPLGFALCGYLIASRRTRLAVVVTTMICGVFSLALESLQVFLPTRDSSMMDVITNLLGGAIGALLYRWATQDRAAAPRL